MKKIILDCDPGMDDSLAIIMAAKSSELDLLAVTAVNGNYPVEITSKNARKILELIGRTDVPAAAGAAKPLFRPSPKDPFTHGTDGQAEAFLPEPVMECDPRHAADLIVDLVKANPHEVTVICTGPMSNLALALMKEPGIAPLIDEVIAISGMFGFNEYAFQNATGDTPLSEWNIYVDPEAAHLVYHSGVNLTAIGLDAATHFDTDFSGEDIAAFRESGRPEAAFLANAIDFTHNRGFDAYCAVIDGVAVAYALDPSVVDTVKGHVEIETKDGVTLGMSVMDRRHHFVWEHLPVVNVGYHTDSEKFLGMVRDLVLA